MSTFVPSLFSQKREKREGSEDLGRQKRERALTPLSHAFVSNFLISFDQRGKARHLPRQQKCAWVFVSRRRKRKEREKKNKEPQKPQKIISLSLSQTHTHTNLSLIALSLLACKVTDGEKQGLRVVCFRRSEEIGKCRQPKFGRSQGNNKKVISCARLNGAVCCAPPAVESRSRKQATPPGTFPKSEARARRRAGREAKHETAGRKKKAKGRPG